MEGKLVRRIRREGVEQYIIDRGFTNMNKRDVYSRFILDVSNKLIKDPDEDIGVYFKDCLCYDYAQLNNNSNDYLDDACGVNDIYKDYVLAAYNILVDMYLRKFKSIEKECEKVDSYPEVMSYSMPIEIKSNPEVAMAVASSFFLNGYRDCLTYFLPHNMIHDSDFMEKYAKIYCNSKPYMHDMIKKLVSLDDMSIFDAFLNEFCGENIKVSKSGDVRTILKNVPICIKFMDQEFKNEKELALIVVKRNPMCIEYLSNELRADKEVVMEAIRNCDSFFMSGYFKTHSPSYICTSGFMGGYSGDIVKGNIFRYIDPKFYSDIDVIRAAIKSKSIKKSSIDYVSDDILQQLRIVRENKELFK